MTQQDHLDTSGWSIRTNPALAAAWRESGDWTDRTIISYLRERVSAHPDQIQLFDETQGYSCAEILEKTERLAGYFEGIGLAPGDVVAFQLPNWWEAIIITLASAMRGLVVCPIVPIYRDSEVAFMLADARVKLLFIPETYRNFNYLDMAGRILPTLDHELRILVVRGETAGHETFEDAISNSGTGTEQAVSPDAVKLLVYTSGTTGRAKGVLHTHNSITADAVRMMASMALGPGDVIFSPSPVTHVTGFNWAINIPWVTDVPAVILDRWEPLKAVEMMRDRGCTVALGATPFLQGIVTTCKGNGITLPDLRQYICGGASVPPALIYEAAQVFPNCIPWRTFGSSETFTITRGPKSRDMLRWGAETDGYIDRAEIKLVDAQSGSSVAAGEEGEILVRTASMFVGYTHREDNEASFDEDGFFRMGDLGRLVEGHFICTGRKKDLIIRSGENISAREIEDVLFRCPQVQEVSVVAMPHPRTGEVACAFIVPALGAAPDQDSIMSFVVSQGVARQKAPERIVLVDELPVTASGKVRKNILRDMAADIARSDAEVAAEGQRVD